MPPFRATKTHSLLNYAFLVLLSFVVNALVAPVVVDAKELLPESYYSDAFPRRPVVGILTEPNGKRTEHYVAASYVKWLEAAGARSIPIHWEADDDHVEEIFSQVNGILLPGGSDNRLPPAAKKIWQLAKEANDKGDYFPVWATCLGYEYLIEMVGDQGEDTLQTGFDSWNLSLPLDFTSHATQSKVFADPTIRSILATQPVTMNNHHDGIEPSKFYADSGLSTMFHVTATNVDRKGRPFVSAIEAKSYPFYGVQFHPEKNSFEYATRPGTDVPYEDINHSPDAVKICLYLAQFFIAEVRKNTHTFTSIDRYPLVWTYEMDLGLSFEQRFVINRISKERPPLVAPPPDAAAATAAATANTNDRADDAGEGGGSIGSSSSSSSWSMWRMLWNAALVGIGVAIGSVYATKTKATRGGGGDGERSYLLV